MKIKDVDEEKSNNGEYCAIGLKGCFCKVGFPYEKMCPNCRDGREGNDTRRYCMCPTQYDMCPQEGESDE